MQKAHRFCAVLVLCAVLSGCFISAAGAKSQDFSLSDAEQDYLNTLRTRPLKIVYSYDLVNAQFGGESYSMLNPILRILNDVLELETELLKCNWHDAFIQIDACSADLYGPIAISESRRQDYITVEPFYRSYSKIVSRVSEPVNSMPGLYNRSIGILEGSVISSTMQAYLGPLGRTVYFPTMDAMINGLRYGLIDAFATVDNAEFEILTLEDIRYEFSIQNFFVDQGFISANEEMALLAEILSRYIRENPDVIDEITALRNETLIQFARERFANEIAFLQDNYAQIPIFAEAILYPLCYDEDGSIKGMLPEINDVFTRLTGIPIHFSSNADFPDGINSAMDLLKTNKCLAAIGVYFNTAVFMDPAIEYSPLLWKDTLRIYTRRNSLDSFADKRLGTTPFASDYLGWNNKTGNAPIISGSRQELLDSLYRGELDAMFIGEMTFNYEYAIQKDYRLREISGLSAEAAMHVMYGTQNPEFNALYNEAMEMYHIINPMAMGQWLSQSDQYKSDYMQMRYTQRIWTLCAIFAFSLMAVAIIYLLTKNLRGQKETISLMRILNEMDVLTEIFNRRYMDENLDKSLHSLSRSGNKLSVLMIDIDYFKRYNDTYGHGMGDECLKAVAGALKNCVRREEDFVARYGGEEFAVVLPQTDEDGARDVAQRLIDSVKALNIPHEASEASDRVSISVGIATGTASPAHKGSDYLKRADEALYISKRDGRNRFTFLEFVSDRP